jgi:hypothetical protein
MAGVLEPLALALPEPQRVQQAQDLRALKGNIQFRVNSG